MPKEQEMVEAIGQQLEKIKEQLGGEYEEFGKRYESLKNLAAPEGDQAPQVMEEIFRLYADYPGVQKFLETTRPELFGGKKVEEQAPVTAISSPGPETQATPPEGPVSGAGIPPASGEAPEAGPVKIMAESKIQLFKERITAFLAVLVVGCTMGIAVYVISKMGDANFNHAKDILILLLGPFGTALGYYFGRLPGDALAAQAQQSAAEALHEAGKSQAKADQISDQAVKVVDAAEAVMGETARSRGIADAGLMPSKTQRLQVETRELLRLARRR